MGGGDHPDPLMKLRLQQAALRRLSHRPGAQVAARLLHHHTFADAQWEQIVLLASCLRSAANSR